MNPMDPARLRKLLGAQVKEQRQTRKWSQQELADKASVSRNTVANIEAGNHSVTLDHVYSICVALDVEVHELLPPVSSVASSQDAQKARLKEVEKRVGGLSKGTSAILRSLLKDEA